MCNVPGSRQKPQSQRGCGQEIYLWGPPEKKIFFTIQQSVVDCVPSFSVKTWVKSCYRADPSYSEVVLPKQGAQQAIIH